ncbi:MAG: hypothetical protein AAB656_04075 [Patescibacteria group bacterium]
MNYLAQKDTKSVVDIGTSFGGYTGNVGSLISLILTGSLVVAGVMVLFMIVYAGIQMIGAAGQNKPENAAKAKDAATYAAIGFVIIFSAYWIIRLIEVITGSSFITAPDF